MADPRYKTGKDKDGLDIIEGYCLDCDFTDGWIGRVSATELREQIVAELEQAYNVGFRDGKQAK